MVSAKEKRLEKRKKALKNIIATWKYYSCESVDSYTAKKIVGIQLVLVIHHYSPYVVFPCHYCGGFLLFQYQFQNIMVEY